MVNLLDTNSFNSVRVHKFLNKPEIKILQFCSPEVCIKKENKKNFFLNKFTKFFHLLIFNSPRLIFLIKTKIFNFLIHLIEYKDLFIFYTGNKKFLKKSLNSINKKFIAFNSQDYSNYLLDKTKLNKKKNYVLFLDAQLLFF